MFSGNAAAVVGMVWLAGSAAAQSVPLPAAPAGVETFSSNGIEFARVRATGVPAILPFGRNLGGHDLDFAISRTEVTQGQWFEFINATSGLAVPQGQPYTQGLSHILAGGRSVGPGVRGVGLNDQGRFIWTTTEVGANIPVANAGWYAHALYSNWMHNGQTASLDAINNGVYDLRGWDVTRADSWINSPRQPGARFWIPSFDEWQTASYFDPNRFGAGQAGWWPYHYGRERLPIPGAPGEGETSFRWSPADPTFFPTTLPVAAYPGSQSPWGLLDTSGTFTEQLEDIRPSSDPGFPEYDRLTAGTMAGLIGPPEFETPMEQLGFYGAGSANQDFVSFRLATAIPSPGAGFIVGLLLVMRSGSRRKR